MTGGISATVASRFGQGIIPMFSPASGVGVYSDKLRLYTVRSLAGQKSGRQDALSYPDVIASKFVLCRSPPASTI